MHRGWSAPFLAWLLVPAAFVLLHSALGIPQQPYTGVILQGDRVAGVDRGSPGERAGLRTGDRISLPSPRRPGRLEPGPLAAATPGRPLFLERRTGTGHDRVWLAPERSPDGERRMMAALLAVSSGFVLLASLVWSERRDRLTRTFFLLCLAFAWWLAPVPRWGPAGLTLTWQIAYSGVNLFLPALFVHFFALFPEPGGRHGRLAAGVRWAYVVATALFVISPLELLQQLGVPDLARPVAALQTVAALWFAAGLVAALALFVRSYLRAGSVDARRRLRVALAGTILGAGPLAALVLFRNLSPGTAVPGERIAVMLTLLVPASFAWAIVVHRIFDFRVALRAGSFAVLLAATGALAYLGGEWITLHWGHELGAQVEGMSLAGVTLVAALAGPMSGWLRALGARLPGSAGAAALAAWVARTSGPGDGTGEPLLDAACRTLTAELRLDGCLALSLENGGARLAAGSGATAMAGDGGELVRAIGGARGVRAIEELPMDSALAEDFRRGGIRWVIPVGDGPVRAVLMLGRRLAGAWLGHHEARELERFADHLAVALENAELRRAASTRGALERELQAAGAIQAHLLPRRAPVYPTLDCAAAALSSESVGGDYYDFVETAARDFTLAVGDAAGKGVPAALVLAGVQARFRDEARRVASPGALLDVLNRELVGLDQPEKFMGLLCARIEVRLGRVWLANAGLTPPLIHRRSGRFEEMTAGGVLLGVSLDAAYPDVCIDLGAGDVVVLCTDGLTEARRGDELFGAERVRRVLEGCAGRRAADILSALLAAVRAFADRPLDDLTVVVLRQLTGPAAGAASGPKRTLKLHPAAADHLI
jgi:serine phosphatase RsbU (regulator of sigma subunit)